MVNNDMYNEDELNASDWLNKDFFEKVLKNVENKSTKVTDLVLTPGTLKNDHYASVLFRAKVSYTVGTQPAQEKVNSYIIKTEPFVEGQKKDLVGDLHLFQTEIRMYTEVLPLIEGVLRQYGDDTVLGPKLIHCSDSSPSFVVFEDLTQQGYTTLGYRHINSDEIKIALLKLAKLHAISYKLSQEKENIFAGIDKGSINTVDQESFTFIKNATKLMKEVLSEHGDLRKFVPLIESVEHIFLSSSIDMFNENRDGRLDGICVLNHGDFHAKNIMVQNVDGKLKDLMLLDYQISIFGSPAIDLHYAFIMMFSPEMRREKFDELLYYYITNFQETLRKTEYKGRIPTNVEFRQELQKRRYWGLFLLLSFLVFRYTFADEKGDIAKVVENEEAQKNQLRDPKLLNELRELLPRFLYNGYFEY
ncbi:uncharacterized protein LOC128863303 isoform X1 [Anastrepha ludens]|uniref:uncharacterized protein LOC128863303 isoform X1 n=1 Tax=Anastrepha ludens TaxID=28586 RepID=UPI0023AFD06B|nr:uncharacterized protein LOC128863303 isoform X1 [Anastrepha ludens]